MHSSDSSSAELRAISAALLEFATLGSSYAEIESMKRLAPRVAALPAPARLPLLLLLRALLSACGQATSKGGRGGGSDGTPTGACCWQGEGADDSDFTTALGWLMDIMFADDSQPLHRQILSALKKLPPPRVRVVEASLEAHIRCPLHPSPYPSQHLSQNSQTM